MQLPTVTAPWTDTDRPPIAAEPPVEQLDPKRTYDLEDKQELSETPSSTDVADPKTALLYTERACPSRPMPETDTTLPTVAKSNTDMLDRSITAPRIDKAYRFPESFPMSRAPVMEPDDPNLTRPVRERLLPSLAKEVIDTIEPITT
jgi:hypothetical protein